MKKILLLPLFTFVIFFAKAQQVYYSVPGINNNSATIRGFAKDGNLLYVSTQGYKPNAQTSAFEVAVLKFDTSFATVTPQEVFKASNPTTLRISLGPSILRLRGYTSTGTENGFYDLNLSDPQPILSTSLNGISVTSYTPLPHKFYQNTFIYGDAIGVNGQDTEIVLPLQTVTIAGDLLLDIEIVGDVLYWVQNTNNDDIWAVDLTNTLPPQIVHTNTDGLYALSGIGNSLYYSTISTGKINKLNLTTNTATTMLTLPATNAQGNFVSRMQIVNNNVFYSLPLRPEVFFLTDNTLSTSSNNLKSGISIHPNPTSSILNIETTSDIKEVKLYSVLGKVVGEFINSKTIDVSNLKPGIYFAEITSSIGVVTERFIKQ